MSLQSHLCHFGNQAADSPTIRTNCEIFVTDHIFHLQSISDRKGSFHHRFRHFEPDEIMVLLRRVAILCHLRHVKPEFGFQVSCLILGIQDKLAKLLPQLWILDRHRLIDGRMSSDIGGIVGECPESEGILVYIVTLPEKLDNEISGTNVVRKIAKFLAAEWV